MNPLTQIKNTQKATLLEARRPGVRCAVRIALTCVCGTQVQHGISDSASWHARYKHSACVPTNAPARSAVGVYQFSRSTRRCGLLRYVYAGGFPYDLTEGDLLAVFSQVRVSPSSPLAKPY